MSRVPGAGGQFHGCVSKKTGVLRVLSGSGSCHRGRTGEFTITWNRAGNRGLPGTPGSPGHTGASGAPGAPGAAAPTYSAGFGLSLAGNALSVDPASVQTRVTGSCPGGQAVSAVAQDGSATCTGTGFTHVIERVTTGTYQSSSPIIATCLPGEVATGGGAYGFGTAISGSYVFYGNGGTQPPNAWQAYGTANAQTVQARVLCAS